VSLSVKILEKQDGELTKTARAWLGGLIDSQTTGYTADDCTISFDSTYNRWVCTGNSAGTEMELRFDTDVSCAEGDIIYMHARMLTTSADMDVLYLRAVGTTGGTTTIVDSQSNPVQNTWYTLSGTLAANSDWSGYYRLRWTLADSGGCNGKVLYVYRWVAINLTAQFGAGDEPDAADLDAFFEWRWEPMALYQKAYALYAPTNGDRFHFASKIADHGLEYNDIISYDDQYYSPVYPLNDDWIITSYYITSSGGGDVSGETDCPTYEYWTKTDRTSRMLAKTFQLNVREDIDASASMSFLGDSTWQPQLGMTVVAYEDTDELFTGRITKITRTVINSTSWRCQCEVSSLLTSLQWNVASESNLWLKAFGGTTAKLFMEYVLNKFIGPFVAEDHAGAGIWISNIDDPETTYQFSDSTYKTVYELVNSLCTSSGLALTITGDRRLNIRKKNRTPTDAAVNVTDAEAPDVWDMQYTEDMDLYGNEAVLRGGYDSGGWPVISYTTAAGEITDAIFAGKPNKAIILTDSAINNVDDADIAGEEYLLQHGKIIPGEFSFVTTILDYRPGQKIEVDVARLGISSKVMNIDTVQIYDVDGINLHSLVTCSNRDSTDYISAPNRGSGGYLSDFSNKVSQSVSAINQDGGSFSPALEGSTTAGTWDWSSQYGYYVRHGNMVYVNIFLSPSSITDSPAGDLLLTGLPYDASALTYQYLDVFSAGLAWGTGATVARVVISAENDYGTFYGAQNNAATTVIAVGNVTAGDGIRITGWYQIAS